VVHPGSEWRWQTNELTADSERANVGDGATVDRRTEGAISKATDVATESWQLMDGWIG